MKKHQTKPLTGSIWKIDEEGGEGLNRIAVELFERGLKEIRPWIPPQYEGLIVPVVDLALVFETYYNLLEETLVEHAKTPVKKEEERRSIAKLRGEMRRRLAPCERRCKNPVNSPV